MYLKPLLNDNVFFLMCPNVIRKMTTFLAHRLLFGTGLELKLLTVIVESPVQTRILHEAIDIDHFKQDQTQGFGFLGKL